MRHKEQDGRLIMSGLAFLGWKIHSFSLRTNPTLNFLFNPHSKNDAWDVGLRFMDTIYLKDDKLYLASLGASLTLKDKDQIKEKDVDPLLSTECEIIGFFRFIDDEIEEDLKINLILHQTPAILLPFLRAYIGSCLAGADFQAPPLPLINLYEMTKTISQLRIIEMDKHGRPSRFISSK